MNNNYEQKIREASSLYNEGHISQDEYEALKNKILDDYIKNGDTNTPFNNVETFPNYTAAPPKKSSVGRIIFTSIFLLVLFVSMGIGLFGQAKPFNVIPRGAWRVDVRLIESSTTNLGARLITVEARNQIENLSIEIQFRTTTGVHIGSIPWQVGDLDMGQSRTFTIPLINLPSGASSGIVRTYINVVGGRIPSHIFGVTL